MSRIVNPTLGSDPEVFVYAEDVKQIVSAIGLIGGSKQEPRPIGHAPGFFVQEDNVLAEFNIPPSESRYGFISAIHTGLDIVKKELPQRFSIKIQPSHVFEPVQLMDPKAQEMGCDPDYNAWTDCVNMPPNLEMLPTLRSSGGHVIVGYQNVDHNTNRTLIKAMDVFLGVPSVILDRDVMRRRLYGKAGAFRHKDFGVEYRTLSSFWLASEELTGWVYDNTMLAIEAVNKNKLHYLDEEAFIAHTINNADVTAAEMFVEKHNIPMP